MSNPDLIQEIEQLRKERNAVILAHSYQRPEIQDIADFVGDSLALARKAQEAECDVIVFCGVHFMAETACILNPTRTVLLPDLNAACSLEQSCPAEELAAFLEENKDKNYYVVAYVNCSIGVKALADVIVTSGNSQRIIETAPTDRPILFVPDRNLGAWTARKVGREMTLWNGACHVHEQFTRDKVLEVKALHPDAPIVCHPECQEPIRLLADHICSTEKMIPYCRESAAERFIIVTESGILHRLRKLVPGKEFIGVGTEKCSCAECEYMKLNTLAKIRDCLRNMSPEVRVPEELRRRAEKPLLRMLELSM
ncbi:MAG: quinolinate synthase NadA [Akkermansia sp.]|nr:quinolinate synthase NadA [Akkermansia sp.]